MPEPMVTTTRSLRWGRRVAIAATVLLVGCLIGPTAFSRGQRFVETAIHGPDAVAPTCSWQVHLQGPFTTDQAGLVRCYLRAQAHRSVDALNAVLSSYGGPAGATAADLTHTRDAQSGTATATLTPNDADSADALVRLVYADGVTQNIDVHIVNPSSSHSWRITDLDTERPQSPDPGYPAPASTR